MGGAAHVKGKERKRVRQGRPQRGPDTARAAQRELRSRQLMGRGWQAESWTASLLHPWFGSPWEERELDLIIKADLEACNPVRLVPKRFAPWRTLSSVQKHFWSS